MSSPSNNSGTMSTKSVDTIVSTLIDLLAGKSAERVVDVIKVNVKPIMEQVAKMHDHIGRVERELMDFKLNVMKEILVIREQLKTITESLVNLDRRFASLPKVEEEEAARGGVWEVSEEEPKIASKEAAGQHEVVSIEKVKPPLVAEEQRAVQAEKPAEKEEGKKQPIATHEDLEKAREVAQLKTRLVRLQLEISSLQSLIDVGLGGVEEKEALSAKLREKKEIEERLEALTKGA